MNYSSCATRGILTFALSVAIALLLSACATTSVKPATTSKVAAPVASASIQELLTQAAAASAADAAPLYLAAAWAQFEQGEIAAAEITRKLVNQQLLLPDSVNSYQLLSAELAIARGDSEAAEQWLSALESAADQAAPRDLARACAADGNYICAANQLILSAGNTTDQNNLIWRYLGLAPGLLVADQAKGGSSVQRGWWQLKLATLLSQSLSETTKAVDFWRQAWPQHPASQQLPSALNRLLESSWQPTHIGVVLPLSGPLAQAGQAVRDGFVVAHLNDGEHNNLLISFYDSESAPLPQVYEQLLLDHVDLVVGPLRKEQVVALNDLAPELPVLALNYLDPGLEPSAEVSQLGLAMEDEASSIVRELVAQGVESLLVFHNYEDWSLRASRVLADNWPGRITIQPFTDIRTITEAVGTAMEVDQSLAREAELTGLLGEDLEFLPRARQDMEAVVALVDNVEANALVPALQFHFADQLPVYACSQVVRGTRRDQLTELRGFQVSELPFYLTDDSLYKVMEKPFELSGNRFSSLHALGIDAFRIALMLGALERNNTSIMIGSTGVLSLSSDGRFQRDLGWSVITDGQVVARKAKAAKAATGA